jgi:ribosomal protein S3
MLVNVSGRLGHRKVAKHVAMVTQRIELHGKQETIMKTDFASQLEVS